MEGIINRLSLLGWRICESFSYVFDILTNRTLEDLLDAQIVTTWYTRFASWLIDNFGWGDITMFEIILGGGLALVITLTIIKWVIGIVM